MLSKHEKNSLMLIFENVRPDKITGVVETLLECYKNQYNDVYSQEVTRILERTVKSMKSLKNRPS